MNPKVSVITVVYNGVKHVEQAMQSVLSQSYTNIEYIMVDGGSDDGTVTVIKEYEGRLAKWISEPDQGIYDAMNKGILMANGELIGILNADDWYEPDAVEKVVHAYIKDPDGEVFHGFMNRRNKAGLFLYMQGQSSEFLDKGMIEHPTCFVKKSVYERLGLFNTSLRIAGDYEFMLRLKTNNVKFIFVPEVLANFREGGASGTFRQTVEALNLKYQYGYISALKKLILLAYFRLKSLLR